MTAGVKIELMAAADEDMYPWVKRKCGRKCGSVSDIRS